MYKSDRYLKKCKFCKKDHRTGDNRVKYCSISCYNKCTKTKGIDGYKECWSCSKKIPFRFSLKVRSYKNIGSTKTRFCSNDCKMYWNNKLNNPAKKPDVRLKIKQAALSRSCSHLHTDINIKKRAKTISGKNHWNWQGGITSENRRRRNLAEYRDWREAVFSRDNYTCQICKQRGGYLEADHIKPWAYFPKVRLDINNGRTLCKECHKETPTYQNGAKKIYGRRHTNTTKNVFLSAPQAR